LEQLYEDYDPNSADGCQLETQFVLVPSLDDIIGGVVYLAANNQSDALAAKYGLPLY